MKICKIYILLFILSIAKSMDNEEKKLKEFKNLLEKNFEVSLEKAYSEVKKEIEIKNQKEENKNKALINLINNLNNKKTDDSEKRKLRMNQLGDEYVAYPSHNRKKINFPFKNFSKKKFGNLDVKPIDLDDTEPADETFNFEVEKFLRKRKNQVNKKRNIKNSKWNPIDLTSTSPVTKRRSRYRKRKRTRRTRKSRKRKRTIRRKKRTIKNSKNKNFNIAENGGNFVEDLVKTLNSSKYQNPIKSALDMVNKEIRKKELNRNRRIKKKKIVDNTLAAKRRNDLRHNNLKKKLALNKRRKNNSLNKFQSGGNELFDLYKAPKDLGISDFDDRPSISLLEHIINPSVEKKKKFLTKQIMEKLNIPHYPVLNPSFRLNQIKKRMVFPKLGHRQKKIFKPTFGKRKIAKKRKEIIPQNKFNDLFNSDSPFSQHLFTNSQIHAETPTHHIISRVNTEHHKIPKNRPVTIDPVKFAKDMGFFKKKMI